MSRRRSEWDRGFSLLEALVALVIVALVVAAGLRVFATGSTAGTHAARQLVLARYAESLLARADLDLEIPEKGLSGEEGSISWQIERLPYVGDGRGTGRKSDIGAARQSLMVVRVTVASAGAGSFALQSLRFAPAR